MHWYQISALYRTLPKFGYWNHYSEAKIYIRTSLGNNQTFRTDYETI